MRDPRSTVRHIPKNIRRVGSVSRYYLEVFNVMSYVVLFGMINVISCIIDISQNSVHYYYDERDNLPCHFISPCTVVSTPLLASTLHTTQHTQSHYTTSAYHTVLHLHLPPPQTFHVTQHFQCTQSTSTVLVYYNCTVFGRNIPVCPCPDRSPTGRLLSADGPP